jgi:hypothetical protein
VGIVLLLIAAIALANRGNGTSGSSASGSSGSPVSRTQPTAPTGTKPVIGKDTAGIPSGFAQTEQGAQSAAANYAVALGSDGMFNTAGRHAIVAAVYDPAVVAKIQQSLDGAYSPAFLKAVGLNADGSTPSGYTFVSRTAPVGTRTTGYTGSTATVEVWCTGLVGLAGTGSTNPVSATWFTATEQLKWVSGDWKIVSSSQKQGPAPVNGDQQAASANEIANAVTGFGGFTYAR